MGYSRWKNRERERKKTMRMTNSEVKTCRYKEGVVKKLCLDFLHEEKGKIKPTQQSGVGLPETQSSLQFTGSDLLTSEAADSRTIPNPDICDSNFKEDSAACRLDLSAFADSFFSSSVVLGFLFTVCGSIVFGGNFLFLFLFLDTVDFCAVTKGMEG